MGTELVFVFVLGFMLLGPRKFPAILGHIARAKAQLKQATHTFGTELDAVLELHGRMQGENFDGRTGERQ